MTISEVPTISIDRLPIGTRLGESTRDDGNVLLLGGEMLLSQPSIDSGPRTRIAERCDYDPLSLQRTEQYFAQTTSLVEKTVGAFQAQDLTSLAGMQEAASGILRSLCHDADLAVAVALELAPEKQAFNERLLRQSVRTSVLSVAIGLEMSLSLENLLHLGTAGLTCDLSLFCRGSCDEPAGIPSKEADQARIRTHPQQTFESLARLRNVPGPVLLSILHHHELVDGSGYPHGLSPGKAPPLPWILGLVQAYLELTEPLYGGVGYQPADTIAYLMYHTLRGRFDIAATRALLRVVSAYPIGSMVKLSDQRVGKVVRRATGDALRPLVRIGDETCDLRHSDLRVVQPIVTEEQPQQRLPVTHFHQRLWMLATGAADR